MEIFYNKKFKIFIFIFLNFNDDFLQFNIAPQTIANVLFLLNI